MSTFRRWAFWRRVQYGLGFFVFLILVGTGIYFATSQKVYDCFDGNLNGEERAVDCGGNCIRICAMDTVPPKLLWAESFEIREGQYNAVAYVENVNEVASTQELAYTFEFLDRGVVIAERKGVTVLPPNSTYPIFEGRIETNGKEITETRLILQPVEIWQPATIGRTQFKTSSINLISADASPRLDVSIENTALRPASDVEIVATLFNDSGTPVTASQTFIEEIGERSTKDIVFTWPNSIAKTVKSCVIPTDVILAIDLSGSMNNDGGSPPEPVSSALTAASNFASALSTKDQVGIVTFASTATLLKNLSNEQNEASSLLKSLSVDPAEERGFTNTADALVKAQAELLSARHNNDARRVIVLLTDGLPTAGGETTDPVSETRKKAEEIASENTELYVIGLGAQVDRDFVTSLASSPEQAFFAPSGNDLNAIYATITSSLCESGTARIDIIAKTKANFTPLR